MAQRVGTNAFITMLGDWRGRSEDSLIRKLYASIGEAISSGVLRPEAILPSERTLSRSLGVSRSTVTAALTELKATGMLISQHGSGTVVAKGPSLGPEGAKVLPGIFGDWGGIDLAASIPSDTSSLPLVDIDLDTLMQAGPSHGYVPAGLPELRMAVADRFSIDGLATKPKQVIVTNGAQHALALAFGQLTSRGDSILVDEPTYPGVIDLLSARGLRPIGLPRLEGGFGLPALRRLVGKHNIRVAYLQTSVHNPTGLIASDRDLRLLAEVVDELNLTVIEDVVLGDLRYDHSTIAPLAARVNVATVVVAGSVSKLGWGGLRIGWLRGESALVGRLLRSRLADDLGSSVPSQVISIAILSNFDVIRQSRTEALKRKSKLAADLISELCPGLTPHIPAGGLSLWIDLEDGSAEAIAQRCAQAGVTIATGAVATVTGDGSHNIRICFDRPEPQLREGIRRLASVLLA